MSIVGRLPDQKPPVEDQVLEVLHRLGEPVSYEMLIEETGLDDQTVRGVIDRLVNQALVREIGHPHSEEKERQAPRFALTVKGYRAAYPLEGTGSG